MIVAPLTVARCHSSFQALLVDNFHRSMDYEAVVGSTVVDSAAIGSSVVGSAAIGSTVVGSAVVG